jgi:integrase
MEPSDHEICPTRIWLTALAAAGRSPKTIESYTAAVGKLRDWCQLDDLSALTRLQAMSFVRHLTETYTPGGVAVRVRALRAGWSWMAAEEMVESNVFARMKISVPETPQRTAGADEIEAMLAHAKGNRRDIAILAVLADTGARRGEIGSLTVADVDLTSGVLTIRVSKTRARRVPLTDRAIVALGRWLRQRGTGAGSLWSSSDPYTLMNAVVLRHSKGQLRCHALRRAFAVSWLERGGSEVGLCRIAGWSSLTQVKRYSAARADHLAHGEMRRLMNGG